MPVCAWCHDEIAPRNGPRVPARASAVSHGICRPCLEEKLATLPALRRPIARRRLASVPVAPRLTGAAAAFA